MSTTNDYNNILSEIQNLQAAEKKLHTELAKLPPNSNFERQKLLIVQIDNINAQKINMFKNLHALQTVMEHDFNTGTDDLKARTELSSIVEQQLQASRDRMQRTRNENINNLRMTEINNYYSGKYSLYLKIFRYIIYTCVCLILIALLRQRYILPARASNGLAMLVVAVGGFFIVTASLDLSSRNNLVINEYDFTFDPSTEKSHQHHSGDKNDLGVKGRWFDELERYKKQIELLAQGECLGPDCCSAPGLTFDKDKLICKLDPGKKTKDEGFTNGGSLTPAPLNSGYSSMITQNPGGSYYASN